MAIDELLDDPDCLKKCIAVLERRIREMTPQTLTFKGMPFHTCNKIPKNASLQLFKLTKYCPYCDELMFQPGSAMDMELNKQYQVNKPENPDIHATSSGAKTSGHLPPYELLTLTLLSRAAKRMELGARKYGPDNWRTGITDKKFILDRLSHALEHVHKAMTEIHFDRPNTIDDDLAACVVNCMMAMEYQIYRNEVTVNQTKDR